MKDDSHKLNTMRIECPECSQRFDVTDDFIDKTVECGSCDSRFKVSGDVMVKDKSKFYPGEKQDVHLERFASFGASAVVSSPVAFDVGFKQAHYQPDVNVDRIGPPRPRRTISAILGVSLMVLVIVIFLLAGGKEGPMRDMETQNRFVLVGFTAFLSSFLVIYGMAQNTAKGVALSLVLGGGLLTLPVWFPGNPTSASKGVIPMQKKDNEDKPSQLSDEMEDYLFEIGYPPVAEVLENASEDSVVAVYIRNAQVGVRDKIAEYLYEETGKESRGTSYDRGDSGRYGLILMENQTSSIDEIASLCGKFGRVNKIHRDLRVIDVTVESSKVVKLDPSRSIDPKSVDFYNQQLIALRSFDREVKRNAVKRLAGSEPKALRDDISKALIDMLPASQNELKLEIIKTLLVWSQPDDGADLVVLEAVRKLHQDKLVDKPAMTFLIDREVDGSEVVLMDLWQSEPVAWSDLFLKLGEGAQILLLPHLKDMDTVQIVAAADILGKVGSPPCIAYLEEVMSKQDEQGKKSLQAAIDEIKKRS